MARKKLEPMVMTPEELEYHREKFKVEMRHRRMWREQAEREERQKQESQAKESNHGKGKEGND